VEPAARAALSDHDLPLGSQEDVGAGSELNEANALAFLDLIAWFSVKDDAARDESGDLFENDAASFPSTVRCSARSARRRLPVGQQELTS
jgi:hypothetical protein